MKFSKIIEYFSRSHRELKKIAKKENINLPYLWYDFLKCSLIHGAILNHYCRGGMYKLKGVERKKSMTYGRILKVFKKCNEKDFIATLNNKHLFNSHFSKYIRRKWLYSKDMDLNEFKSLCNSFEKLIEKPEDGVEGHGVRIIDTPKSDHDINKLYEELKKTPYMVEECIVQHPDIIFNNTSVNTLRVHSLVDNDGTVRIMKVLLRAGVGDSVVDNYANGGCVYEIDVETGHIISPSLMKSGEEVYIHPGTEIFMLGKLIPNWDMVIETVQEAHKLLPKCRFIGWDVAVTPYGTELIEGNHNPDYELLEFFGSKGWYEKIKKYI